jgi:hypothetical protein
MQRLGWFVMNQGITNAKTGWFYTRLGIGKTLYQIGMVFNNTMAYTQINTLVLVDTIVIHNCYFYSGMIICFSCLENSNGKLFKI